MEPLQSPNKTPIPAVVPHPESNVSDGHTGNSNATLMILRHLSQPSLYHQKALSLQQDWSVGQSYFGILRAGQLTVQVRSRVTEAPLGTLCSRLIAGPLYLRRQI